MSHMREGQTYDNEISQFGIGLKAAGISLCDRMDIYTQVEGQYYKIEMDFIDMINRENPNDSFNPKKFIISQEEYNDKHKYKYGSTIILTNIDNKISYLSTDDTLINEIKNITETYNEIIKETNVNITINEKLITVNKTYFEASQCKIFNNTQILYITKENTIIYLGKFRMIIKYII